ncbi:Lecithin:cholesterol acyltransferase-domain-containing protein [Scenedesmus sp. NREL 46B-D3]|nr:Lecithin:cholesterol acyltransferase-domain-containing protein [Scenedesmus sp. NREL 46B-D3]
MAVIAVTLGVGVPKAAQDERVRAAVNDSVSRLNTTLVEQFDVSLDGFLEKLANLSDTVSSIIAEEGPRPGQLAAKKGMRAHHPVVIVPGFVTSGLELWQGEECAQSYFRQRLWGTLSMAQTLLADRGCWMRHMKLDPVTGSDPPGIKLRAAKALEAVDYFVPGYWVFSKLVQSLADIGYDNNNLLAVPYDWRLAIPVMQKRDGFFTRLKNEVELQLQQQHVKPVLVSHSYGATVTMAFFTWVEAQQPGWVDKHLHGYLNLAGPMLGLPKAISPLLSGETRETVDMMAGLAVLVEQYLGKQSRAAMFRTWGSVLAMLPVGGPKVWGNATHAPDDDATVTAAGRSYGGLIALVRSVDSKLRDAVTKNDSSLISSESLQLLTKTLSNWGNLVSNWGSSTNNSDGDGEETDSGNATRAAAGSGPGVAGEAAGNASGKSAKDVWTSGESVEAGEGEGGSPKEERADVAGGRRLGGDGNEERQKQATEEAEGGEQPVRFLDVHSALLSLAATAGEQLTINMQRWAPAARDLDLSHVLAHHRKTALQLAAQHHASCSVDPDQPGDYQGTCQGSAEGTADCTKHGNGSGGSGEADDSCAGESDAASKKLHKMEELAGVESSTTTTGEWTQDEEGSTGEHDEVRPVNPVTTPLPNAPHLKLYCMYGVGTPTERGYHYLKSRRGGATEWSINSMVNDPASGLVRAAAAWWQQRCGAHAGCRAKVGLLAAGGRTGSVQGLGTMGSA